MTVRKVVIGLTLVCMMVPAVSAAQAAGEKAFAEGGKLLQQGDFEGALKAYTAAASENPREESYRMRAALVERVIEFRKKLDEEKDDQQWATRATALHVFYHMNGVYGEALKLDQQIHAKVGSTMSAAMLARTQLALNQNAETVKLLSDFDGKTTELQILLGIAQARQGEMEQAKELAAASPLGDDANPEMVYDRARLLTQIGQTDEGMSLLRRYFEITHPNWLGQAKATAQDCVDFASIKNSEAFTKVLATESSIKASGCSGGASCGQCPSRSKCSSVKTGEEKKEGCQEHEKP
ncbi:MAG: hypothetical protein JXO22_06140 [Phycisphaerae bacterium]|nr:hypothetical protein [Phycisphaerae bacterium]